MSNSPTIGQGPGNLVPDTQVMRFLANGAVVKGDVLTLTGTTGYTVDQCSAILPPIGVAMESGTDVWIKVCVGGFCDSVTCTVTDLAAYDLLTAVAAGECDGIAAGSVTAAGIGIVFGMTLAAVTGIEVTSAIIFNRLG